MKCERCGENEGEYVCSVCKRVVCKDCKIIDNGKIYCADHAPKNLVPEQVEKPKEYPTSLKILKDLIFTVFFLLVGILIIYLLSNLIIAGLLTSMTQTISENFPQLEFMFVLLTYFESAGLYAIIALLIILIILIVAFRIKKRRYKNI